MVNFWGRRQRRQVAASIAVALLVLAWGGSTPGFGQSLEARVEDLNKLPCCDYTEVPGVVWAGNNPKMTFAQLAAYCAPIVWYSPDEPLLMGASGKDILIPESMPFEEDTGAPIVYYRVRTILHQEGTEDKAYVPGNYGRDDSIIDLEHTTAIDLDYFFYYHREVGLGGHENDCEAAFFKIGVWKRDNCEDCRYALLITSVTGKAHGLKWLDNTLDVDTQTVFPMTLLAEEGKHASCTDKNSDGYYTPGYDVNRRVNDAWGVRDIMRSGSLYTGGFEAWMDNVRHDEHRILPPLPADSMLRERLSVDGEYAPENAVYEIRPLSQAAYEYKPMAPYIGDKGTEPWPALVELNDWNSFARWMQVESFMKSLSFTYRYDGDHGFSLVFPLFIVKNYEEKMTGGYLSHRIYFKDKQLRDFGWMLHYTPSASRWLDSYFSAGVEWDVVDLPEGSENSTKTDTHFVLETGIKLRFNLFYTPLRFMSKLTDYWGVRIGIRNVGAFEINKLIYVLEIGGGIF